MKVLKLALLSFAFFTATQSQAQIAVNVNLGTPPAWAHGNVIATQYYYLPEIDAYYDVPSERFIYIKNGKWVKSKKLPKKYSNYNLKKGRIIYLSDYKGNAPYKYHKKHKEKYVIVGPNSNNVIQVKPKLHKNKHKNKAHKKRLKD
ncbi:MAG: hypothetical protein WCY77_06535 [Weeksellaceae bacterium]